MAKKQKKLGQYVKDRKNKYQKLKIPKFLVHVSLSPRRVLYPKITPYAWDIEDSERAEPLLFLSPVNQIVNWLSWCYWKSGKKTNENGFTTLYIHIIKTKVDEIYRPNLRYCDEYYSKRIQKPVKIIPIRYYPLSDKGNLSPLVRELKILKKSY